MATFYYAIGDTAKQKYVISALEDYGGKNDNHETGADPTKLYYIDVTDRLIYSCLKSSELGQLLLGYGTLVKTKEISLPETWKEFLTLYSLSETDFNKFFASIKTRMETTAEASSDIRDLSDSYIAYIKLTYLRDCYRMEWLPQKSNTVDSMWAIYYNNGEVYIKRKVQSGNYHFSFQDEDIATLFYTNFIDLIDTAKYVMGYEDDFTIINIEKSEDITLVAIKSGGKTSIEKINYGDKFFVKASSDTASLDKYKILINHEDEYELSKVDGGDYYTTTDITNTYQYQLTISIVLKEETEE